MRQLRNVVRPRDRLGRPLPWGTPNELPEISYNTNCSPEQVLRQAQYLFNSGYAFSAHEIFEEMWKNTHREDKGLWQALVCLAVGITHCQRNNSRGAISALNHAIRQFQQISLIDVYQIDIEGLVVFATNLREKIQSQQRIDPAFLCPKLCHFNT